GRLQFDVERALGVSPEIDLYLLLLKAGRGHPQRVRRRAEIVEMETFGRARCRPPQIRLRLKQRDLRSDDGQPLRIDNGSLDPVIGLWSLRRKRRNDTVQNGE